jgi:uncharacterized membrane protein
MLPSKHFGSPKAEHWAGVVDAFYPIILTLLIIELPGGISEILDKPDAKFVIEQGESSLITLVVFSYLLVFLIIYEVFCIHRALARCSLPTRRLNQLNGLSMAIVSLFPPVVYIVNQVRKSMIDHGGQQSLAVELQTGRLFLWAVLAAIYGSFWLMSATALRSEGNDDDAEEHGRTLREVRLLSIRRLIYACILFLCVLTNNQIAQVPLLGFSALVVLIYFEHELLIIPKHALRLLKKTLHS